MSDEGLTYQLTLAIGKYGAEAASSGELAPDKELIILLDRVRALERTNAPVRSEEGPRIMRCHMGHENPIALWDCPDPSHWEEFEKAALYRALEWVYQGHRPAPAVDDGLAGEPAETLKEWITRGLTALREPR